MTGVADLQLVTSGEGVLDRLARLPRRFARFARTQPLGAFGLLLVIIIVVIAIFGEWMVRADPDALSSETLEGPGAAHWFGTDSNGRDYYSRMVSGGRITIALAVLGVVLGFAGGTVLGVISAWAKGWLDLLFQRVIDALLALPGIILALFLVTVLGRDTLDLVLVLTLLIIPPITRFARGTTLSLLTEPYIEAAHALGARTPRVLGRHLFPNLLPSVAVVVTTSIGSLLLISAGLSFLGLGVQPPTAEWGNLLAEPREFTLYAPYLAIFPGLAISLAVLGVNLFGDAIRDVWDPRLRSL